MKTISGKNLWAITGVLFVALFMAGDFLRGVFTDNPLPMPNAPASKYASYAAESWLAVIVVGVCQVLSGLALYFFVTSVISSVVSASSEKRESINVGTNASVLSALLLILCGLLGFALVLAAQADNLGLVGTLRQLNFLSGGTFHVAALGIFIGVTSATTRKTFTLPHWIVWLGLVQAVLAVASLASLVFFPAALLILAGRMLGFVWCLTVGFWLAFRPSRKVALTA